MDTDLKCNRLTCRRLLNDKAVVTTCRTHRLSHILRHVRFENRRYPCPSYYRVFNAVECANELFNASRLCPACETTLSEPDDVVVCSLHPSNDYKTSVLSGLSPSIILEICSRAISFWQYQIHQENSFQQAVVRNVNDKNAQLQKQLENVVREANGEINLLSNKNAELERDLELERRKVRDLQDAAREQDKEYQKLKAQHDKIKRKALLGPNAVAGAVPAVENQQQNKLSRAFSNPVGIGAVVGGMEASGIQRTPLVNRTSGAGFAASSHNSWGPHQAQQQQHPQQHVQQPTRRTQSHRQPFAAQNDRGYQSGHTSDRSTGSAHEVENILLGGGQAPRPMPTHGWSTAPTPRARPAPRGMPFSSFLQ
ncbi:E3 ubiquitin-protein ligase CCNB1IP1 [Mycena venus]|uniref:E3 ubiquitin-protein ligase CCNB1IP1 n=1 Tax=Mycena venus TaxID=2733690 RepID=A0A8H7CWF9_9AGAR|nr:E3 ubiquitin-protein ligase CCNB1IP1 [Mycena venus]